MYKDTLTQRQKELLVFHAQGLDYSQIADKCSISYTAVNSTFGQARKRICARTNSQLIVLAIYRNELEIKNGICAIK